jgi:hypothetical protein
MSVSMAAGIGTSLILETVALRLTEQLSWRDCFNIAWSMSVVSMLVMELTENMVDRFLTGGMVHFSGLNLFFTIDTKTSENNEIHLRRTISQHKHTSVDSHLFCFL